MADRITEWLEEGSLYIALVAAWVAMAGSLYFSEVVGYIPCKFCWYQRILMYPLAVVIAIGLVRRDRHLPLYILPFSLIGIGVASYHYLLQKTDLFINASSCEVGVPCSGIWINWFGFVTIPFLALLAFLLITLMAVVAWQAGVPADPAWEETAAIKRPWVPVVAIILIVLLSFYGLSQRNRAEPHSDAAHAATTHDAQTTDSSRSDGAADNFTQLDEAGSQTTIDGTPVDLAVTAEAAAAMVGANAYAEACAACHGDAATGVAGLGTDLTASTLLQTGSESEILAYMRAGSAVDDPNNQSGMVMPPSGGRPDLDDETLLAIIRHLQTDKLDSR